MRYCLGVREKNNGEWVEGNFVQGCEKQFAYIVEFGNKDLCRNYVEVIPETIRLYTGLTDKNGTKIFEGDYWIDTDENDIFVVDFRNGQYCFVIYGVCGALMEYGYDETAGGFGECDCVPMTDYDIEKIEIIGNIHDNPELLKEREG